MWSTTRVMGYNCKRKVVVMHNSTPIVVCDGMQRASLIISYANGYDVELDKGIKKLIDKEMEKEDLKCLADIVL